jgi:hypothetical protein
MTGKSARVAPKVPNIGQIWLSRLRQGLRWRTGWRQMLALQSYHLLYARIACSGPAVGTASTALLLLLLLTLVFYRESRRDFRISPLGEKLPRVKASRCQSGANCMHVVKLKRVAKSAQCVIGVQVVATSSHQRPR